jgi:WD40 repeat protein
MWITQRTSFIAWIQERALHFSLYWLQAPPGTGKSVISAHVIEYLTLQHRDVVHFFFSDGNKYHRTVASLLRCIALGLANKHPKVHHAIRNMQKEGVKWDEMDETAIWKKLFINCIFKIPLEKTQFWVIDALDECIDMLKFFPLLHRLKAAHRAFALRIFVTSRPPSGPSIDLGTQAKRASTLGLMCTEDRIASDDTEADIRVLLKENIEAIPVTDFGERANVLDKIVQKAQGSFLWANIVLKEMQSAYSVEEMERILEEVPIDMVPHYEAILAHMSKVMSGKKPLIQAILTWVVCGNRPLSDLELEFALRLDMNLQIVGTMRRTIEGLCGQILIMDKKGMIRIIHATAREFLFDKENQSEYGIKREEGNARLAKVCLEYLLGDEMKPKRAMTGLNAARRKQSIVERVSPFADYASTAFTFHLVNSHSEDEDLFNLLAKFLQSPNILSWIEYVALQHRSLEHIREAGSNIRRYMHRRSKHIPPVCPRSEVVNGWSVDLLRVVSRYGRDILDSPYDFIRLVPPMCPRESRIFKQFARNPNFYVVGLAEQQWADAISYIEHDHSDDPNRPRCIASGPQYFAIGEQSATGRVRLFSMGNFQECTTFEHEEPVLRLAFNNAGKDLITSGQSSIKYWDLSDLSSPTKLWTRDVKQPCLSFFFADDDERLIAATADRRLHNVALDPEEDEGIASFIPGQLKFPHGLKVAGKDEAISTKSQVSFSADGSSIAFVCLNRTVAIWSVDDGHFIGVCEPKTGVINNILLNPNVDLRLLLVSHGGSHMTLFDYDYHTELYTVQADCTAMASTVDGKTLATSDSLGDIELWEFESLTRIYKINYRSSAVRDLTFSSDGQRLVDTRETHSVVWESEALIRTNGEDDNVSIDAVSSAGYRMIGEIDNHEDPIEITALECCGSSDFALVGKENGTLSLYNLKDGQIVREFFALPICEPVTHIAYHQKGSIALSSMSRNLITLDYDIMADNACKAGTMINNADQFSSPLKQLLWSIDGSKLLVAYLEHTHIWSMTSSSGHASFTKVLELQNPQGECWNYFSSRAKPDGFYIIDKEISHFLPQEPHPGRVKLRRSNTDSSHQHRMTIRAAVAHPTTGHLIVEYCGPKGTTQLIVLERIQQPAASAFEEEPLHPAYISSESHRILFHLSSHHIKTFLGLNENRVVYLANHLWIKSVDLMSLKEFSTSAEAEKERHFFIPHEYIGGNRQVRAVVGYRGEIAFPRRGELAVVWGGLGMT